LIRGSVNALERAWSNTLKGATDKPDGEDQPDAESEAVEGVSVKERPGAGRGFCTAPPSTTSFRSGTTAAAPASAIWAK
jgi:hypothetical protein